MKLSRRKAREITLCLIFDFGFNSQEKPDELLDLYLKYYPDERAENIAEQVKGDNYIQNVYFGVAEKVDELDEIIRNCSQKWKLERISRISVSILRMAIYELLYVEGTPHEVTVNEAVEISKKYDTEESYTFINGVLGAVITNIVDKRQDNE